MYAQSHLQSAVDAELADRRSNADTARQLIAANEDYARANDAALPPASRSQARRQARTRLTSVLERDPDQAMALSLLGRVELDEGRLTEARALFDRALELEPANGQLHCNLGYWALKAADGPLAEDCFQQALTHDRQSAAAFCGMAHAKRLQGAYDVAFLHYRKLLDLGLEWTSVYSGMIECAEQLEVERCDGALARDGIRLLATDGLPHQSLGRFVAALLRHQYDLDDPNGEVFLDTAARDELLLLALERTLLPDPAVEELVTLLRRTLLGRVMAEQNLDDAWQRLAMALGRYAERTGYALLESEAEARTIGQINSDLKAMLEARMAPAELAGSVMISAMYGALFHQAFAADLGRFDLGDWPEGLQPLMAASYYDKVEDEAYKQRFAEKDNELAMDPVISSHAWPCWNNLRPMAERALQEELRQTLGVNLDTTGPIRVLLLGCRSGQRALELARYYTDVEIIAVDPSLGNLARGARHAQKLGLENLVFWPLSLARQFIEDGNQVQFVELESETDLSGPELTALVDKGLANNGLVHIHTGDGDQNRVDRRIQGLVAEHRLAASADTIRQLRRMVLNNRWDSRWGDIARTEDFYGTAGCLSRWFRPAPGQARRDLLGHLGNEVRWRLVKAKDEDGQELATAPVQTQLAAERHGSSVQTVVGQGLRLYFQRR